MAEELVRHFWVQRRLCRTSSVFTPMRGLRDCATVPNDPMEATRSGSTGTTTAPRCAGVMPAISSLKRELEQCHSIH